MINKSPWLPRLAVTTAFCVLTIAEVTARTPQPVSPEIAQLLATLEELETTRGTEAARDWLESKIVDQDAYLQARQRAVDELAARGGPGIAHRLRGLVPQAGGAVGLRLLESSWQALVAQERNEDRQVAILLDAFDGESPETPSSVRGWAARELCSRGVEAAWEPLMAFFSRRHNQRQRLICKRQIAVLRRCGWDRLRTMEAVLNREDPMPRQPLHRWALQSLAGSRTPEADALLLAHALRLQPAQWSASQNVAALLLDNGWTRHELTARGIDFVPPWIRHPPRPPRRDKEGGGET